MLLESARLRAGLWHIMAILARHRPSSWHVFQRKLWCTKQSQLIVYRETYMRLNLATTCEDHLHSCPFLPPNQFSPFTFLGDTISAYHLPDKSSAIIQRAFSLLFAFAWQTMLVIIIAWILWKDPKRFTNSCQYSHALQHMRLKTKWYIT